MAKTLLQAVNEILTRTGIIAGDSGELSSLTDSARQVYIDAAVQVVNEGIDELYTTSEISKPLANAEDAITLSTGVRSYSLAADLVRLHFPLVDKSNTQFIWKFPGGYNTLLLHDPEQDDTGLPHYGVINPGDGKIYLDTSPGASENGNVYTYQYLKDTELSADADTVPFDDMVFRAMVPAWVQLWKREQRNQFDGDLFIASIGRASRILSRVEPRSQWFPR